MKYRYSIFICALMQLCAPVKAQTVSDTTETHIAYGKQPTWAQSAAISTVKGERLMDITSPTVGNSLKGMLPGLSICRSQESPVMTSIWRICLREVSVLSMETSRCWSLLMALKHH